MLRSELSVTAFHAPAGIRANVGMLRRGRWLIAAIMAGITLVLTVALVSRTPASVEATQVFDRRQMAALDYTPMCE